MGHVSGVCFARPRVISLQFAKGAELSSGTSARRENTSAMIRKPNADALRKSATLLPGTSLTGCARSVCCMSTPHEKNVLCSPDSPCSRAAPCAGAGASVFSCLLPPGGCHEPGRTLRFGKSARLVRRAFRRERANGHRLMTHLASHHYVLMTGHNLAAIEPVGTIFGLTPQPL